MPNADDRSAPSWAEKPALPLPARYGHVRGHRAKLGAAQADAEAGASGRHPTGEGELAGAPGGRSSQCRPEAVVARGLAAFNSSAIALRRAAAGLGTLQVLDQLADLRLARTEPPRGRPGCGRRERCPGSGGARRITLGSSSALHLVRVGREVDGELLDSLHRYRRRPPPPSGASSSPGVGPAIAILASGASGAEDW